MTSATIGTILEGTQGSVKAERLILVNLSSSECHAWLASLRDAGQPWHEELVNDLAKVKVLLQTQPKAHALICYDAPERQIANCIDKGRVPSQALANWMNQVETLLELYRKHYHRITLVGQEALHDKPKALFDHLAVRSGIALGRVISQKPAAKTEPDQSKQQLSAMNRLLALHALQHPPAKRLAQELEASSLPLGVSSELFDLLDGTYEILKHVPQTKVNPKGEDYQELKVKLADVQQENELIIEQLHKTQEELEQYLLDNKDSKRRIEKLQLDIKDKQLKLDNFSQRNQQLSAQLKNLRNSKSWKVTAPLRACMKVLGGKKGGAA